MAVRNKTEFEAKKIYFITFTVCEWQKIFTSQKYLICFIIGSTIKENTIKTGFMDT
jgi:DMSO reductase anchor subunit